MIMKREIKMSNVLIGITGSIAAYKACELIRFYKKQNDDVKVVLTPSSLLFIGEKTLETLTGNPVYYDMCKKGGEAKHISLAYCSDIFVIAPVSADSISNISAEIGDTLLTSISCT